MSSVPNSRSNSHLDRDVSQPACVGTPASTAPINGADGKQFSAKKTYDRESDRNQHLRLVAQPGITLPQQGGSGLSAGDLLRQALDAQRSGNFALSQDAIAREKPQDGSGDKAPGAETGSSEPKGQELNYAARVSLDHTQMQVDEKLVNLSPGMAVTVEIKTGSRRIIKLPAVTGAKVQARRLAGAMSQPRPGPDARNCRPRRRRVRKQSTTRRNRPSVAAARAGLR